MSKEPIVWFWIGYLSALFSVAWHRRLKHLEYELEAVRKRMAGEP
jgi:hypothetical protein